MEFVYNIPSKEDFIKMAQQQGKTIIGLPITHEDVVNCDIRNAVKFFNNITASKSAFKNSVILSINGYDFDKRELFEIDEVRLFIQKLVNRIPHLFYYIYESECFSWVMSCYADSITTIRTNEQKNMSVEEAHFKRFVLKEDTTMPLHLLLSEDKLKKITGSIKVLGHKVGDSQYAIQLANRVESMFKTV